MSRIDQATEFLETFARTKRSLGLVVWQAYAPLDIGPKQVLLMRELARAGSLSQAELARATMTDPAATSRAVQTLVTLGWVRRVRNDEDQRERVVEITAAGRATSKKIEAAYARAAKQVVASLDARDHADFQRVARKLLERCGELRDDCRAQCEALPPVKTKSRSRGKKK